MEGGRQVHARYPGCRSCTWDYDGDGSYLVELLPAVERGGEVFRDSFALNWNEAPTAANRADWGNIIAHELFHFWNGTRLRGADYVATQWFQEGFTEYMANTTQLATGQVTADQFHARLAKHVDNYRKHVGKEVGNGAGSQVMTGSPVRRRAE